MAAPAFLPHPPPLANLAGSALGLFLDFDGTLVDIAERPDAIVVRRGLAEALVSLASRFEGRLALVSGRSLDDLERHCGPLAVARAGSHGLSRRFADGTRLGDPPLPIPSAAVDALDVFAREHGVDLEYKAHGAALHSRRAPQLEDRCALFVRDLAAGHDLSFKLGKRVAELVQPGSDKGAAVDAFMTVDPFRGCVPIFVGDDLTDEDGFAACERHGGFGIAVGARPAENARYALADPAAVQHWLDL